MDPSCNAIIINSSLGTKVQQLLIKSKLNSNSQVYKDIIDELNSDFQQYINKNKVEKYNILNNNFELYT